MKKWSGILSRVVAILFILIGLLHTDVHFRELDNKLIEARLSEINDVMLLGKTADIWKLWQGFSFMMGVSFVIIGVLRLLSIREQFFINERIGAFTMIILLIIIIISGTKFFGPPQIYGGAFGLLLQCMSLGFLIRSSAK